MSVDRVHSRSGEDSEGAWLLHAAGAPFYIYTLHLIYTKEKGKLFSLSFYLENNKDKNTRQSERWLGHARLTLDLLLRARNLWTTKFHALFQMEWFAVTQIQTGFCLTEEVYACYT